jgi:hypothetical protein
VQFSNPIFSSNSQLAIIEVSFLDFHRWGYGNICVLRKTDADWVAQQCMGSWIN